MFPCGEFLTIQEVSEYLHIKPATLYSKVESGDLPYYKLGRLLRFKLEDIDRWMETHRRDSSGANTRVKAILKATNKKAMDVDGIVKKAVEEVKGNVYTSDHGRPDRIRGLRKGVSNGSL
jgi:excisionase family DNA binding protein